MTTIQQQMTALIVRTDPTLDAAPAPTTAAAPSSPFSTVRLLVLPQWAAAAPDPATLATTTAVLDHFLTALLEAGTTDLDDADGHAHRFVEAAPTLPAWHLRKNTLMAAYGALRGLGAWPGIAPLHGLRPPGTTDGKRKGTTVSKSAASSKTPRNIIATSDEVLLARVCARLDCTGDLHRRAAALAIASGGAATGEGAPVCWTHHTDATGGRRATLQLPGRHQHNHDNGWHSTPRTVELDDWSAAALADWHAETSSYDRPLAQQWSIVYGGAKPLGHQSAKNSYHALIKATLAAADLDWIPGLTPLAIGEWAAAHATLHHGLDAGAHVMGVDQGNCHRRLMKAATRAYRAN